VEADTDRLELAEEELLWSRADAEAGLADAAQHLREVTQRDKAQAQAEEDFTHQESNLQQLEDEVHAGEDAVAEEELGLLEARSKAESELKLLRDQRDFVEQEALSIQWDFEDCGRQLDEVEREQWALEADQKLLDEIEAQVEPIRLRLLEREKRLQAEEQELRAQEADCEEREAQLLPEYQRCCQSLAAAESRQQELSAREQESLLQQQRLVQQQRDLGCEEIRLSGKEGALQRYSGGSAGSDVPSDVEEMRRKLARLQRGSESDWAERLRLQQAKVQQLEARLLELQDGKSQEEERLTKTDRLSSKLVASDVIYTPSLST